MKDLYFKSFDAIYSVNPRAFWLSLLCTAQTQAQRVVHCLPPA